MEKENNKMKCHRDYRISSIATIDELCIIRVEISGLEIKGAIIKTEKITPETIGALQYLRVAKDLDFLIVEPRAQPSKDLAEALKAYGIRIIGKEAIIKETLPEEVYTVRPRISIDEARKIFETRIKSSLKGVLESMLYHRKIEFLGHVLAYYPMRCYQLLLHSQLEEASEIAAEEAELCFELATGSLVKLEDDILIVDTRIGQLGELEDEVISLITLIGERGEISLDEISEIVGSSEKAEIIVQILLDYGIIERVGLERFQLKPLEEKISHKVFTYLKEKGYLSKGRPSKCSLVLEPGIDVSKLDRLVKAFGRVTRIASIFIPVYIGVFRKKRNEHSREIVAVIDGIWGERLEDLEELIASSRMLYKIYEIMNELMKKQEIKTEECLEQTD